MTLIEILLELSRRIAKAIRKHLLTTAVRDAIGVYRDTLIASTIGEVSHVLDLEQSASLAAGHSVTIDEITDKRVKSIRHIIYLHKNTPFNNIARLGLALRYTIYYILTNGKSKLLLTKKTDIQKTNLQEAQEHYQ
jgi:hypothetical protein